MTTANEIKDTNWELNPYADVIDSREVIERIDSLENAGDLEMDEAAELQALIKLQDEAEGYADDWRYGSTLIRYSYFKDYAQDLADGIGAIPDGADWPAYCIDWERAANDLRIDYTSVDFAGVEYLVR